MRLILLSSHTTLVLPPDRYAQPDAGGSYLEFTAMLTRTCCSTSTQSATHSLSNLLHPPSSIRFYASPTTPVPFSVLLATRFTAPRLQQGTSKVEPPRVRLVALTVWPHILENKAVIELELLKETNRLEDRSGTYQYLEEV